MSQPIGNAQFARLFLEEAYERADERTLPPVWAQVLCLVEEAGEFASAYRRSTGWARRDGDMREVAQELADVVITAYVAAERLGINLDREITIKRGIIMSRGFGTTPATHEQV